MTRLALLTEIPAPFRIPLFNELARREGIELRVFFLSERDPKRPYRVYAEEAEFASETLPGWSIVRGGRWTVVNRGVLRRLRRFHPDVVIAGGWNQPAFWQALAYARTRRVPTVAWVESTSRDARTGSGLGERAKRLFVRLCAAVLVPGSASREYVRSLASNSAIAVAPNAVDPAIFGDRVAAARVHRDELRRTLELDGVVFLYVGRLDPEKGLDVLFRAFADMAATLVVIGGGTREAELHAAAPAGVRFVGRLDRDDLVPWYAAADAFVLPSLSDQWALVLNEAAEAGMPLVSSNAAGAAHDLIDEGVNGFRVPAGDVLALRMALERVASDERFRASAGARSRELAASFTPGAWADTVVRVSRELARGA